MSELTLTDFATIGAAVGKAVVILLVAVICAALLSWGERRILAVWQDRYGPNRVGPGGVFQLGADMLKMLFKEDWVPPFADKLTFLLAPIIAMSGMLIAFAIVPITPNWGVADLNIGILFFLAIAGMSVYAVLFAGWSSNNKYALIGSLRSAAQTVSYEVFLGIALMGVVVMAGSFNMRDIVAAQAEGWYIGPQIIGFIIFVMAGLAVTHRAPFDLPEAESEIADGYHIEYAGMKWAMFFVGEYVGVVLVSALITTLYLGGWHAPALFGISTASFLGWVPAFVWFALKTGFFIMMFILARAALPRPRYDQVMDWGWKLCLPLSILNLLVTGFAVLMLDGGL